MGPSPRSRSGVCTLNFFYIDGGRPSSNLGLSRKFSKILFTLLSDVLRLAAA